MHRATEPDTYLPACRRWSDRHFPLCRLSISETCPVSSTRLVLWTAVDNAGILSAFQRQQIHIIVNRYLARRESVLMPVIPAWVVCVLFSNPLNIKWICFESQCCVSQDIKRSNHFNTLLIQKTKVVFGGIHGIISTATPIDMELCGPKWKITMRTGCQTILPT